MYAKSPPIQTLIAILMTAGVANAAAPEVPPSSQSPPDCVCSAADPGARRHDGLFARSDTGLALFFASVAGAGAGSRTGIRGIGQSATLSLGGTPARGLVVGGAVWTARLDPVFFENGRTIVPDDDSVKLTLLRVGPFVDFYPDPTTGFHTQAALQLAVQIESDEKGNPLKPAAFGAALSAGAGYEWFVSDEFSLGLLARAALGRVARAPAGGEQRMLWAVPELALTATYH